MSATFSRTLRSLEADGSRRRSAELLLTALLSAWAGWFLLARVTVYVVTDKARLEAWSAAHAVAAPVDGRVVETRLTIGRPVTAGEVLVRLDGEAERLLRDEQRVRRDALKARLEMLRKEIQAEQEALRVQRQARTTALEEARAEVAQVTARTKFAQRQLETSTLLRKRHAIAEEEFQRSKAELEASQAAVRALEIAARRLEHDRTVQLSERQVRLVKLERETVELAGEQAIEEAAIRRLEYDLERRLLRAPVAGRVGEAAECRVGAVVRAAEKLGSIVPDGAVRAVALFPVVAVGRLRPGQSARLRLDGFPWTQFGTLPATVADVGNEASAGLVRVELTLAPDPVSPIPREHGPAGSAEVAVAQVSPAVLVLRAAGQLLSGKRSSGDKAE